MANKRQLNSRQAIRSKYISRRQRLTAFFRSHIQAIHVAIERMYHHKLMTAVTIGIMGLGLSLPLLLALGVDNLMGAQPSSERQQPISLLLHSHAVNRVDGLLKRLRGRADVSEVNYVSPQQGLALFQSNMPRSDLLINLPNNPIPPLMEVTPSRRHATPQAIEELARSLSSWPEVASVKVNMQWVERLHQWLHLFQILSYGLMTLLIVAVLLVSLFNIYHAIHERREEIYVVSLVGGTYAYIRRPFLYTGILYGALSACLAWGIVSLIHWSLYPVITHLNTLYSLSMPFIGLDPLTGTGVMLFSGFMGLAGAWFASELEIMTATQCS